MEAAAQLEALLDLEARHEDLLARLDELDQRVETVLRDCLTTRQQQSEASQ